MIRKFSVGDIVVAHKNAPYLITTNGWKGKVLRISTDGETLYVIETRFEGTPFQVKAKHFDIFEYGPNSVENMRDENGNLVCSECGCVIEDETTVTVIDGKIYCEDCRDENFVVCYVCGNYVRPEDGEMVDDEFVCEDCMDNSDEVFRCDNCNEYHLRDRNDYIVLEGGDFICEDCASSGDYVQCDGCHGWFYIDDLSYNEHDETYMCANCERAEKRRAIHSYSYKPDPVFKTGGIHDVFADERKMDELFFGVELEIDKGSDDGACATDIIRKTDDVYCKHDGSLYRGVEIVSHPCSLKYHLKDLGWDKICDIARSYDFTSQEAGTCGLHIHVGRYQMGENMKERDDTAAKLVLLVDRHWDSLTKFSRRRESQLSQWATRPYVRYERVKSSRRTLKEAALDTEDDGRYQAVNLTNENTVEFRMFNGTLRYETIYATLEMVSNMVLYAKEHSEDEVMHSSWKEIVNYEEYKELKEYIENRGLEEGEEPFMADYEIKNEFVDKCSTDQPTGFDVGDKVIVVNDNGSNVSSLTKHLGETATILRVCGRDDIFDYLIDFGHVALDLHTGNGTIAEPRAYFVYKYNIALAA